MNSTVMESRIAQINNDYLQMFFHFYLFFFRFLPREHMLAQSWES